MDRMNNTTIGLDIAKSVFHYAELNRNGTLTGKGNLKRNRMLSHFAGLEPTKVVMEACATSHYWGRQLQECNHEVVLLPAHKVTPYVQGSKNDQNDALAIAEAAGRPGIRTVAVKTVQQQDLMMLHGLRQQAVQQRTQKRNALRAHLSERGLTSGRGKRALYALLESVITADEDGVIGTSSEISMLGVTVFAVVSDRTHHVHLLSFMVHYCATHRLAVHRNTFVRITVVRRQPVVDGPIQRLRTHLYHHVANHRHRWHLATTVAKPAAEPCPVRLAQRARPHPDVLVATHATERGPSRQRQHVCDAVLASLRTAHIRHASEVIIQRAHVITGQFHFLYSSSISRIQQRCAQNTPSVALQSLYEHPLDRFGASAVAGADSAIALGGADLRPVRSPV